MNQFFLAQTSVDTDAFGGLILIAICIGLCIAMNQPKTKITDEYTHKEERIV